MYYSRDIEQEIKQNIDNDYILLLLGARQVGKTTVIRKFYELLNDKNQCFFINLENPEYKALLNQHPENLFKIIGTSVAKEKIFIFIDEIQYLDNPTNFLKFIYDEYKTKVKLIVTGSSAFYIDNKFKDSLSGRKKIFNLYTLNFGEFLRFKGEKQIYKILSEKKKVSLIYKQKFDSYFSEYITYGGYPRVVLEENFDEKKNILESMSYDYIKKDIYESKISDEEKYFSLMKILAHQCGGLVNANELSSILGLSQPTIENYLYVMQKSFHVALINPFYKNIRKEISKMKKVYFYDLGLRNQLIGNFQNIEFRSDKGEYLENIFFKEFLFKEKINNIKYWRTINQNEVDFIINEKKAFEIKFSEKLIKQSKYKLFKEKFPDIDLEFVTFNSLKEKYIYV
jgi:hypothetical protein